jgi:hypothetical protein
VFRESARGDARLMRCEEADGTLHGPSEDWFPEGGRRSQGGWVHGREHGRWVVWDALGTRREERFYVDGELNGVETVWYATGSKRSVTYFEAGVRHGRIALWDEQGRQLIEGRLREGRKHGLWTIRGTAERVHEAAYAVMVDDEDRTHGLLETPPANCDEWLAEGLLRRRGFLAVLALHSLRFASSSQSDRVRDEFSIAVCIARESALTVARVGEACETGSTSFATAVRSATVGLAIGCSDVRESEDVG